MRELFRARPPVSRSPEVMHNRHLYKCSLLCRWHGVAHPYLGRMAWLLQILIVTREAKHSTNSSLHMLDSGLSPGLTCKSCMSSKSSTKVARHLTAPSTAEVFLRSLMTPTSCPSSSGQSFGTSHFAIPACQQWRLLISTAQENLPSSIQHKIRHWLALP